MRPSVRRRTQKVRPTGAEVGRRAWLAPVFGAAIIVALSAAASFAQATSEVFIAASLLFSVCEGIVLAFVGYAWNRRGVYAAATAGAAAAALAAPGRWEFALIRFSQPVQPTDLVADLVVSIAWGALAGLAGATFLRPKIAALTNSNREHLNGRSR
jgi:hypothetical protein